MPARRTVLGTVVPAKTLRKVQGAQVAPTPSRKPYTPAEPVQSSRKKVYQEPPMRGQDPEKWLDRLPRFPHPTERDWKGVPDEVTRHEQVPVVCACNDTNSMIALQTRSVGKKPEDFVECWCTLCWSNWRVPAPLFRSAYKKFVKMTFPPAKTEAAKDEKPAKKGGRMKDGK